MLLVLCLSSAWWTACLIFWTPGQGSQKGTSSQCLLIHFHFGLKLLRPASTTWSSYEPLKARWWCIILGKHSFWALFCLVEPFWRWQKSYLLRGRQSTSWPIGWVKITWNCCSGAFEARVGAITTQVYCNFILVCGSFCWRTLSAAAKMGIV